MRTFGSCGGRGGGCERTPCTPPGYGPEWQTPLIWCFGSSYWVYYNPFQHKLPEQISEHGYPIFRQDVHNALEKCVITKVSPILGHILSSVFHRPKTDGTHRLILILKRFNESVSHYHPKMDSLLTWRTSITLYPIDRKRIENLLRFICRGGGAFWNMGEGGAHRTKSQSHTSSLLVFSKMSFKFFVCTNKRFWRFWFMVLLR